MPAETDHILARDTNQRGVVKHTFFYSIICILLLTQLVAAADTTYSKIRIKRKKDTTSGSWNSSSSSSENDTSSSCIGNIASSCFESMAEGCIESIRENRQERRRLEREAYVHSDSGTVRIPAHRTYFDQPLHLHLGLSLGFSLYDDSVAQGGTFGVPLALHYFPTKVFGMRLYSLFAYEGKSMNVDFERDYFINGTLAGVETFDTDDYRSFLMPLRYDLMLVPPVESRHLFFSLGGGFEFSHELVRGSLIRGTTKSTYEVTYDSWSPTGHIGMGMLFDKSLFELSYNYSRTSYDGQHYTPSDNSRGRHRVSFALTMVLF